MNNIFFLLLGCLSCLGADVQTMSLEEKVGQVLMVHFHGAVANVEARSLIQDVKVGGIIYYNWSNELSSPGQIRALSKGLQAWATIPLFIAVDQEGGVVSRLNEGFTVFPGNKALGMAGDPHLAEEAALAMGQEARAVGVNMILAPVVDVNINPRNPVIGIRSFGEDPNKVVELGKKALEGYKKAKVISTLKHFPGHGDVEIDSHEDLPHINKSMEALEQVELLPFTQLAPYAEAMMTAHLLVPALDKENCSTVSEKTLAYLKNTIGFKGVILSDSLVMEGILKRCHSVDEAAIQALQAGCDVLILGGKQLIDGNQSLELTVEDVRRVHRSLVAAVKTGRIAESRINEAVEKILSLKEQYPSSEEEIDFAKHKAIAQKIAARALRVTKRVPIALLDQKTISVFAPQILQESIHQTSLPKMGKATHLFFGEDWEGAKPFADKGEVLIVCSYNAWKNPKQLALIQSLLSTGKPVILFVLRDSLDASLFPDAPMMIETFSPTSVSIQAACEAL